jgi:hypothetical protein
VHYSSAAASVAASASPSAAASVAGGVAVFLSSMSSPAVVVEGGGCVGTTTSIKRFTNEGLTCVITWGRRRHRYRDSLVDDYPEARRYFIVIARRRHVQREGGGRRRQQNKPASSHDGVHGYTAVLFVIGMRFCDLMSAFVAKQMIFQLVPMWG